MRSDVAKTEKILPFEAQMIVGKLISYKNSINPLIAMVYGEKTSILHV